MGDCIFISLLKAVMGQIHHTSGSLWWVLSYKCGFLCPKVSFYRTPDSADQVILASCSLTDFKSRACGGMSGWQHEPQRSVHPLLCTISELCAPWRCTEWWCLWSIYDRSRSSSTLPFWVLRISCCSGSRLLFFFFWLFFFFSLTCHQKYTWNLERMWECMARTLPVLPPGSLCSCSTFLTSLSLSLYIFCITPNTLLVPQYQ